MLWRSLRAVAADADGGDPGVVFGDCGDAPPAGYVDAFSGAWRAVSSNSSGAPFLIVGDNAQALFQNLPLTGSSSSNANANATYYLSTRQGQGINAIPATLVCSSFAGCATNTSQTYDNLTPFSSTISPCGTTTPNC
jgi:hypothetical protein